MENNFKDWLVEKGIYFEEDTEGLIWTYDEDLLQFKEELKVKFPDFSFAPIKPNQQSDE